MQLFIQIYMRNGIGSENYKSVSYYYVDDNKYIYVDEIYKTGNINDIIGTTQELYYSSNNPALSYAQISIFNIFLLVTGIFIIVITVPIIFMKNKILKRYN